MSARATVRKVRHYFPLLRVEGWNSPPDESLASGGGAATLDEQEEQRRFDLAVWRELAGDSC